MSLTCYAGLAGGALGQVGPPAQLNISAQYSIVDTATNTALLCANGSYGGSVEVKISTPITKQADLLPFVQTAIQAQEPAHPSLSFIWIGL
jgi:hypothetical protein